MSAATVSPQTIEIVTGTVPILRKNVIDIASQFYENLFKAYPAMRKQFNVDRHRGGTSTENGVPKQIAALANAVLSYAKNIANVSVLVPVVERISHKHISRGVSAAQYDAIGECLIKAMNDFLGESFTGEMQEAWTEAYNALAKIFIDTEKRLKVELEESAGYSGFAAMTVADIEEDEDGGRKIALKPEGLAVPPHGAGQFVAIRIEKEGAESTMTSMSTIREEDQDALWILVPKCEERASRFLLEDVKVGTVLDVSIPCGKVKRAIA